VNHDQIKGMFPILRRTVNGHHLVYLDSAASAQKPLLVTDAMKEFSEKSYANVHRGIHYLAEEATEKYEEARSNVAYALAERGYEVAILDADVDCPNVPKFLGMSTRLRVDSEKRFVPVRHQGVKIVSMGLTRDDEGEPFLIRGPAKHRVAIDLLTKTDWGALDFLIIDLPPGTADVPMSMFEFGNVEEILYVTSPQKESLIDTKKSIRMGITFGIKATGIVENMSGLVFGQDTALALAKEFDIPYLGSIPLSDKVRAMNERGDIMFTSTNFELVAKPIVDAVIEPPEIAK